MRRTRPFRQRSHGVSAVIVRGRVTGAGVLIAVALSLGMAIPQAARANHYCAENARSEGALVQLWRGTNCTGASVVADGWRPSFKAFNDAATGQVVDVNNDISSVAIKPGHCVRFWNRPNYQGDPSTILCTPPDPEDNAMSSISFDDRAASLKVCAGDRRAECNADGPSSSLPPSPPSPSPTPTPPPPPPPPPGGGGTPTPAPTPTRASPGAEPNHHKTFLQVYDNNIENLETPDEYCKGDWKDLVYFMKLQTYAPDLFLVQQVSGRKQLDELTEFMSQNLPGHYEGVIARGKPRPFKSRCRGPKKLQTNAIVYRLERFDVQRGSHDTFRSTRRAGNDCVPDTLDRTENVLVRLTDKINNNQTVVAGSIHWPTRAPACTKTNARQAANRMLDAGPAALRIFGGDANFTPGPWKRIITGDFGYGDACGGNPDCPAENWTVPGPDRPRRIDFLFSRNANEAARVTDFKTVTFEAANAAAQQLTGSDHPADYSDHRALAARIHY